MKEAKENPKTNVIGGGISENDVLAAIKKSGYPLQTVIADRLRKNFHVQEEWSYIDRDTNDLRTIDILAQCDLYDIQKEQPRVRPQLSLLLECKQSLLPYIFFLSSSKPWLPDFPVLAGLSDDKVAITTDDDRSSWTFEILHMLGLDRHQFITDVQYSMTLSKCVRKGAELELSGSDSYNSLILPLLKAMQHFKSAKKPVESAVYFDAHLTLGLGVLDAPIIGVTIGEKGAELTSLPWVRVLRHESIKSEHPSERSKLYVIDVVHSDYLTTYISDYLSPFAKSFSTLAIKHQQVIATGSGFISGMGQDSWTDIENRLKFKSVVGRIARRFTARKKE